jgi:hypothetical protein
MVMMKAAVVVAVAVAVVVVVVRRRSLQVCPTVTWRRALRAP